MSKYLLLADTHLSSASIDINCRLFKEVVNRSAGCDYILHLGDVFTSRLGQRLDVLLAFTEILDSLPVPMIVLPGNHDKISQVGAESYLDVFETHRNLIVHRNFSPIPQLPGVWGLPYFEDNSKLSGEGRLLLAHAGIEGYYAYDLEETISANLLTGFEKIYSGHYHDFKEYGKITYVGSCYQVGGFGEDLNKGFWLLDENYNLVERVLFTDYDQYQTYHIDLEKDATIPSFTAKHKRVIVKGQKEQVNAFQVPSDIIKIASYSYDTQTEKGGRAFEGDDLLDYFNENFKGDKALAAPYLHKHLK